MVASADQRGHHLVLGGDVLKRGQRLTFGLGRSEVELLADQNGVGHGFDQELIDRVDADGREHCGHLGLVGANVS